MATDGGESPALVLQLSADNAKMLRAFEQTVTKIGKYADQIEGRAKKMAHTVEEHGRLTGEGFGKALDRVFNSSRVTLLEEGAARVSIFGGALEALGPIGIAAAAGIGAFALTMEHTEKAVEYAAGIAKVSKEVGVTTDFLQKFNFAAHQNEIDVKAAGESLKALNASLGLVQSGLARTQLVNAFKGVGFTPEQLRQYQNAGDLFPVLAQRISHIGSAAEQAAIAKRLGISELLPLLKDGAEGFDALARKAQDLGIVMSHATIERAEEAKKKLTELDDVMKAKANISFAEFAQTLITVKTAFLEAETAGLRFLAMITGTESTGDKLKDLVAGEKSLLKEKDYANNPVARQLFAHYHAEIQQLLAQQAKLKPEEVPKAKDIKALVPPKAGAKGSDQTLSFDKAAQDAYDSNLHALAEAQAALITGIHDHADAEKAAVDDQLTKQLHDLDAKEAEIKKAKIDAHRQEQLSLLGAAKIEAQLSAELKKELIDRTAAEAARQQALQTHEFVQGERSRIAANNAAEAPTDAERHAIEFANLVAEQKLALDKFDAETDKLQAGKSGDDLTRFNRNRDQERGALVEANQSDLARKVFDDAGPLDKYLHSIQNLNTAFQEDGVAAIQSLSGVLVQMGEDTKHAGSILEHWLLDLAIKMASQEFTAAAAPALSGLFKTGLAFLGLAGGGRVSGPGTSTSDSIPAMLSDKEFVVNAEATSRHLPLLEAINSGRTMRLATGGLVSDGSIGALRSMSSMPARAPGGVMVLNELHFHAEGAVVAQDLLDQAKGHADKSAAAAAQWARAGAVADVTQASYHGNWNG
jgi:hypothetical protein